MKELTILSTINLSISMSTQQITILKMKSINKLEPTLKISHTIRDMPLNKAGDYNCMCVCVCVCVCV